MHTTAQLVAALPNDSHIRANLIEGQVKAKYERMLHPPLTYLGDAFKYRTVDGRNNSALNPHLGQAGAPYAKTVPSKTHPLGALPDPGDLFDLLDFIGQRIAEPENLRWHDYFRHYELGFNKVQGQQRFRADVEQLLARGGEAFTIDSTMRVG